MSKKITTVIFDFDGTIADTMAIILPLVEELGREQGIKNMSQITLDFVRNNSIRKLMAIFKVNILQLPFLIQRGRNMLKEKMIEVKIFPDLSEVLTKLHDQGYLLGILSSNSVKNIELFLAKNKLEMFSFIHSENNVFGKDKALKHLLQKHTQEKNQILYVGDETRDVEACKKAGVLVAAVTWGFNSKKLLQEVKPNAIIDTPAQLLQYINES